MIKAVLMDLGQTVVTNEVIDFKKGLKAIYDLANNSDKKSFDEYIETFQTIKTVTFDYRRKAGFEVRFIDFITVLNKLCNVKIDKTPEELEDVFQENFIIEDLVEGVLDFLKYLKSKNIIVYALSNSTISSNTLKKELAELGALEYFNDVISSADIYVCKPRKEIFESGIGQIKKIDSTIKTDEIAFIGNDYVCDMIGSSNCGLFPIWINKPGYIDELGICKINKKGYEEILEEVKSIL